MAVGFHAPVDETAPVGLVRARNIEMSEVALFLIGATLMAGHVQAGLGRFGPLALLPIATYGLGLLAFVLAIPGRLRATAGIVVCAIALVLLLPGLLQAADTDYGINKVSAIVQLTAPFALMAALLVDRLADMERFWGGVMAMGILGLAVSMLDFASGVDLGVRGSINEAYLNPISIGRIGGVTALWFGFGGSARLGRPLRWSLVAMGILLIVAGASRGPMLALLVAGFVAALRSRVIRGRLAMAILVLCLVVAAGVGQSVLEDATERVVEADRTTSAADAEGASRARLWSQGVGAILDNPIGRGFAQFGEGGSADGAHAYPHNILIEFGLELGFLAVIVIVFVWWRVARYLWTHPNETMASRHLALLIFWTVAAMFSSDLNGNRVLIAGLLATAVVMVGESSAVGSLGDRREGDN